MRVKRNQRKVGTKVFFGMFVPTKSGKKTIEKIKSGWYKHSKKYFCPNFFNPLCIKYINRDRKTHPPHRLPACSWPSSRMTQMALLLKQSWQKRSWIQNKKKYTCFIVPSTCMPFLQPLTSRVETFFEFFGTHTGCFRTQHNPPIQNLSKIYKHSPRHFIFLPLTHRDEDLGDLIGESTQGLNYLLLSVMTMTWMRYIVYLHWWLGVVKAVNNHLKIPK